MIYTLAGYAPVDKDGRTQDMFWCAPEDPDVTPEQAHRSASAVQPGFHLTHGVRPVYLGPVVRIGEARARGMADLNTTVPTAHAILTLAAYAGRAA